MTRATLRGTTTPSATLNIRSPFRPMYTPTSHLLGIGRQRSIDFDTIAGRKRGVKLHPLTEYSHWVYRQIDLGELVQDS